MVAIFSATLGGEAEAETITFNDPIVTGGDRFGQSMALDGNNVLISAYHHAFSLARLMICRRAVGWRDAACADSSDPRLWVFCDVTHQAAGHEWVAASFVTLRSAS